MGIDPCYSLLAKTDERSEEQKIAAMGKSRWMSKGARRKGPNLRSSGMVNTQNNSNVVRVDWTPVFARGKLVIYVVDPDEAARDSSRPQKLADAANLAKLVRGPLPEVLEMMRSKYQWADLPRVVVHDKASYMVTAAHERLHVSFAGALHDAGFKSWTGDGTDSTEWLVKLFGDVYLHETVISHIRRLLDTDFAATKLCETPKQFKARMKKVEDFMNSDDFQAPWGAGLLGLAKELLPRCREVVKLKGERIPK